MKYPINSSINKAEKTLIKNLLINRYRQKAYNVFVNLHIM